jgi:hypothetical protein
MNERILKSKLADLLCKKESNISFAPKKVKADKRSLI